MPVKNITAAVWNAVASWDGLCHGAYPAGDYPNPSGPVILYTDIVAGQTSGGENNLGCYLSIFGRNFGAQSGLGTTTKVYINNVEVANYRALVAGKSTVGFPGLGIQHICVQVGALGGLAAGASGAIKVVVGSYSSNTDHTFTNQPGPIIFVDETNGDDANPGTIYAPMQHMQVRDANNLPTGGALTMSTVPGTTFVLRGGPWSSSLGKDTCWFRFWRSTGAPVTGAANAGYLTVTAYPGPILGHAIEDVHYTAPASCACIQGNDTARAQETTPWGFVGYSQYVVISNLHIEVSADSGVGSAPINLQTNADHWRVVNNELGPWPTTTLAQAGGLAGNGRNVRIHGNWVHDIGGMTSQRENHGMYFDGNLRGSEDVEVSYNYIHNIAAGSGLQCYTPYGVPHTDINLHNNVIDGTGKYGINFADSSQTALCWNNLVLNTENQSLRFNTNTTGLAISVCYNTFYNGMAVESGGNCMASQDWTPTTGYVEVTNNIFVMSATRTNPNLGWWSNNGGSPVFTWDNNLYYDPQGNTTTKLSSDAHGIYGDPKFLTGYTDLRIQDATSPARNAAGTAVQTMTSPTIDINAKTRPLSGNTNPTIGAYEAEV